jgi:hypothetical protein
VADSVKVVEVLKPLFPDDKDSLPVPLTLPDATDFITVPIKQHHSSGGLKTSAPSQ